MSALRYRLGELVFDRRSNNIFLHALLLAGATLCAGVLRDNLVLSYDRVAGLSVYLAVTFGVALIVIPISGIDRTTWRLGTFRDCAIITLTVLIIVAGSSAITFAVNRLEGVPRTIPILQLILSVCVMVGLRLQMGVDANSHRSLVDLDYIRSQALAAQSRLRTVLIVGRSRLSDLFVESLNGTESHRVQIAGIVDIGGHHAGRNSGTAKVIGAPENIEAIVLGLGVQSVFVDTIVVAASPNALSQEARRALLRLERASNIRVEFLADRLGFCKALRGIELA